MSYHHNEKDEWLRYGAAMYLRNCNGAVITQCAVTGGQNALMMMQCTDAVIYNNDFSFNSGIGLGMYRCSNNKVLYNRINFNVRGYSDGVYNRGQDSAGILVYEQSNDNLFYKNLRTVMVCHEKNVLNVVLHHSARLIGLAVEAGAVALRFGYTIRDLVPDYW